MDRILNGTHDRAWRELAEIASELEQSLAQYEEAWQWEKGGGGVFTPSARRLDNLLLALQQVRTLRHYTIRRDVEGAQEAISEMASLGIDAGFHIEYYARELKESLSILSVTEAELLYDSADIVSAPKLILSVSDSLLALLARQPKLLYDVTSRQFEEIIAELFRREGFDVHLTQPTRDGGTDIIAVSYRMNIWQKLIIECKKYAPTNRVGIAVVQRLLGVKAQTSANKAVIVTTSSFSRDAERVARERFWDLDLKAYNDVVGWIRGAVANDAPA